MFWLPNKVCVSFSSLFLVIYLLASCTTAPSPGEQRESDTASYTGTPNITFEKNAFDLGQLQPGEVVSVYLNYTNTGEGLLIVQHVKTTCGCTATDWNKEPLKPGESEKIEIIFDSKGLTGKQVKNISIQTNASDRPRVITLTADIQNAT